MTDIYVDADACPVREEIYRVANRIGVRVHMVSNGSRPIRPPGLPNVAMVVVGEGADVADDWIAERISARDVCVTSDIPLAARCLEKGARTVSPNGKLWTQNNIGNALAGRQVSQHMREIGLRTGGPSSLTQADRSRFLSELDTLVRTAQRVP
ncbi:MAG: YaiI/YqxD family protein [Acetobacteraceae bacterium]|nr:YaiI/YqxD family protein [Acetobacteraceae bacterium]